MSLIRKEALEFALTCHASQRRKCRDILYIEHPKHVVKILDELEIEDLDIIVAAYLHDVLEDTNATYGEIEKKFNTRVAKLVQELTSEKELRDKMGKVKYLTQKMTEMSSEALTIKLADRLDNIGDLAECPLAFQENYVKETQAILKRLNRSLTNVQKRLRDAILQKISTIKKALKI